MATSKPSIKEVKIKLTGEYGKGFKDIVANIKELNSSLGEVTRNFKTFTEGLKNNTSFAAKEVSEELEEVNKEVKKTGEETKKAVGGVKGLGKAFEGLGARIRTFAQYRIINMMTQAVVNLSKAAIDLESNFANIQAITSASDTEMEKLRGTILRVGEASKYSVEEIANATTMLGQAGLSADEINNVLETTTQLAAGTGSELSNTVDLMTSALAVWGLNSEEASHLSDVMVTGMNRTKATLETFRMAVQYAGATMASLNVSFDEFASVAAAASNAGLRASVVGTGLRAMTSELISPTKKMVRGLAELGLSTEDVNIESQGLVNVLYKLKNAGLTAANAYDLFGKRAAQFVLAAQGQLDVVDELRVAFNKSGATLKAYSTQMDTISAQATALGNTVKEMASNILDSISWMIKDTLKGLNKALQGINWLFSDKQKVEFEKTRTELEDSERSAKTLYDFTEQLSKRDYGPDKFQAIEDLNVVVEELNKKFDKNVDYVKSVDDLADAYERVKDAILDIDSEKVKELNAKRESERERLLRNVTPSLGLEFKYGKNAWEVGNYTREYLQKIEESKGKTYKMEREIDSLSEGFEKNIRKFAFEKAKKIFEELPAQMKSSIESSSNQFKTRSKEIQDKISSINETIATQEANLKTMGENFEITEENVKNVADSAKEFIATLNNKYGDITDETNKDIEKLNKEVSDQGEREELAKQAKDAKRKTAEALLNYLNNLVKLLEAKISKGVGDTSLNQSLLSEIKKYTKDETFTQKNAFERFLEDTKETEKQAKEDRRSQREIERDKARQFNLKYQGLAIQQQADSYQADIEQARRKGMKSGYDQLDKTGTIGSAYSRYSADKERLEKFKTAYANQETLDKYMKDYGDLFKQVKSGKVSLEDADNKSDKLISKMIELQKSTEEARAEFGDLNETNLEDVNEQIAELDEKMKQLDEDSKTTFGQMWIGFQDAVTKMAQSYSMANLGATIAQDLGNGVSDALYSIVDGTKSAKEAFSDMARSILQDISKMLIRMAVMKAMEAGLGFFSGGGNVQAPTQGQLMMGGEYANGGFIPKIRAALGTPVRGGIPGKDSVPAMLMPGEYVLKKSAVDALGTNFLNDLNNNAAQTLTNTSANLLQNPYESGSESEPAVVNVWVVSKEEEVKMGPNDVIATISKDIMTGGQTRRLIQSVVAGRK